MSAGCFSWCRPLTQLSFKNRIADKKSNEESPNNRPAIVSETNKYTSVKKQVVGTKSNEELSENTQAVVPIKKYITASGKQVLTILESAAGIVPVPMLRDAIGVALKIIELCEEASAVEEKVKELQDRVGHLMIIILAHVTDKNEEGNKEVVVKAAKGIEEDIKELFNTLGTISKDLAEIKAQNRWVIAFYKDLNMSTLEDCMNRLSAALEKFKACFGLANDLRDSDLLQDLHSRLETMVKQVDGISKDMKHVVNAVDNIQHNFQQVMSRVKRSGTLLSSDAVIQQPMPLKPEVFYGRDSLVEEIAQSLTKEQTSRICILGPGGMGKTSVSLAVVESPLVQERFLRRNCVWVPCIGATSAALLLEILYVQLQVAGDKQVTLKRIISELNSPNDPHLILFDNFETPWNAPSGTQKEVEDILRQLAQLNHVAILVTMRGKYPPCDNAIRWQSKNIEPTDEGSCVRMFHEINPSSKDDPDVGRLLRTLGYMPFAVTLMASLGKEGQSTANDLLNDWSDSGPDIISDSSRSEKSMNRCISLSVDSPLVQQNSNAVFLLATLSLLPVGTTKENLRWWAPTLKSSMISSAIAILSRAGLLLQNKREDSNSPILFIVPVVQSYMQQQNRIPDEIRKQIQLSCCDYVLDHACRSDEPLFIEKSKALAAEDSNIQSILFDPLSMLNVQLSDRTMDALIAFCWYRCDTKPNPDLTKHAVTVAEASGIQKYIALAEWCLGRTYHFTNTASLAAFEHLQMAYKLFSSPGDLEWQRFGGKCGIDLVDAARLVSADVMSYEDVVRLAHDVESKCATLSDDLIHGRSLLFVGFTLHQNERLQEALYYLDRAKTMLEAVGNALNIAEVYQAIGIVHFREQRIPAVLDAMEEAWKHAEVSNVPYIQADISLEFGMFLFGANRDTDAWKYIEIALMKCSYTGNQIQIATVLEYMGYGYLRRADYQDAYSAYDAAAGVYLNANATQSSRRCKDNMAQIKQKLTNPDKIIGFYRPDAVCDDSLFYTSVQTIATSDRESDRNSESGRDSDNLDIPISGP